MVTLTVTVCSRCIKCLYMNDGFLAQTDHIGCIANDLAVLLLAGAHILETSKFKKNKMNQMKRQSFKKSGTGSPNVYMICDMVS